MPQDLSPGALIMENYIGLSAFHKWPHSTGDPNIKASEDNLGYKNNYTNIFVY